MKRIETLLNREIGLCARSIGTSAIECGVRGRLTALGGLSVEEYVHLLTASSEERRALIEDIVVSETWFFRDEDVFGVLTEYATGAWRKAHAPGVLRVLSIPCATGEEAYSASVTLLEAGLVPTQYAIQAVDVSERALQAARRGIFGKNSFRGARRPERSRYFTKNSGGQAVIDEARASVKFTQGNVLDPYLAAAASFNVIFCRNLLIYLDKPARTRALDNIHNWLAPDGMLFGGHAEALESIDARFERAAEGGHFGYVKRRAARPATAVFAPSAKATRNIKAAAPQKVATKVQPRATPRPPEPTSLAAAKELADAGNLSLAVAACERHLAQSVASAEAYCLLGILRTALGELEGALESLNKAVYLEPSHYAALAHLALIHERRGDATAAQNFRRRANQALGKGAPV